MAAIDQAIALLDRILAGVSGAPSAAAPAAKLPKSASEASASTASEPAAAAAAPAPAAGKADPGARDILVNRTCIKVARITSAVPQPNSAKLLKMQADLGGGDTRQIMAGLAQYIKPDELAGRLVCVVANLKPAKLAGEVSEAMVLAAEAAAPDGQLLVRTLLPPEGSQAGDLIHLDGAIPPESYPGLLKLDVWRKVAPGLVVAAGGKATFEGTPLVTSQGLVTLPAEIPDGSEIH